MSDTIENIRKELAKKERSIQDLIRYIGTRNDDNPNYSLLLGAGCSITSGVRSAMQLIREWKSDIYRVSENKTSFEECEIERFFKNESWYNDRNPYSSLFEKKFDLPRQRRMFIEKEVRDKTPSIGYAYLIKLVENNFFKTLFTTNFDDLLNEAFYQYSSQRPLVCAHDSAISSITVTSKRPKIIKLHGDYLFDDIKSTLRETESLEDNIKNKFVEFAKDYGLIITGYGGNDRSIVDILTYLLKSEDYFKHGIYWCLREDSEISDDLKKMFWKDRVYFVVIDGFDELMAEINSDLNKGVLPIDNSILNDSKIKLIDNLTQNDNLKDTRSDIIKADCKKLLNTRNKGIIDDFFKYLDGRFDSLDKNKEKHKGFVKDENKKDLNESDQKIFFSIQQLLLNKEYEAGLDKINIELKNRSINNNLKIKLLEYKADILEKDLLKNGEELNELYDKLIEIDRGNINYYLGAVNSTNDFEKKLEYLDEIIAYRPFVASLYYHKAQIIFDRYNELYKKDEISYNIDDIISLLDKSISVNPSIANKSWALKCSVIEEKYTSNKDDLILEIEVILEQLEKQNKYHPFYVSESADLKRIKKEDKSKIFDYVDSNIIKLKEIKNTDYLETLEFKLLRLYADYDEDVLLDNRIKYIEETYNVDDDFYYLKANYYFDKFNRLDDAISILESIKNKDKRVYERLVRFYIHKNDIKKAEEINEKFLQDEYFKMLIFEKQQNYEVVSSYWESKLDNDPYNVDYIISYSYILLKQKKYKEAENFAFKHLNKSDYSEAVLLTNYYIAQINLGKKVSDKIEEKLINYKEERSYIQKAAAYALLGNEKEMLQFLKKAFNKDNSYRYIVTDWPVFENYVDNSKFKETVALVYN